MAALLSLLCLTTCLKAEEFGEYQYQINGSTITITGFLGHGSEVAVPGKIGELPVTAIGPSAFAQRNVRTVTLPDGITSIGDYAFHSCQHMTGLSMPASVTHIGAGAFSSCSALKELRIPDSVTHLGIEAFYGCVSLTGVTLPGSMVSIGERAFIGCTGLTSATLENGITFTGNNVFPGCTGLTSISLPDSLLAIGDEVFTGCWSLTSAAIPRRVTSIGKQAFFGCGSMAAVTLPDSVTSIGTEAFAGCWSLISAPLPRRLTSLGAGAFSGCALTSATLPDSLTSIGEGVFAGCWSLASVTLPVSLTSIETRAFAGCRSLVSVSFPRSVTIIAERAFGGCSSLGAVTIPASVISIGKGAFSDCTGLVHAIISDGVTSIGDSAFRGCSSLDAIIIPASVTSIGEEAFRGCTALTGITLPPGLTSVNHTTFMGCTALTGITLPAGLTSIGESAFVGCTALTAITLPPGVTSIGGSAFTFCTALTVITLPSGLTSIGDFAFDTCTGLTGITIPAGVTSIGYGVFMGCRNLVNAVFLGNAPAAGSLLFPDAPRFFTFIAKSESTGFTFPNWQGNRSLRMEDSRGPFMVLRDNTILKREDTFDFGSHAAGATVSRPLAIMNTGDASQTFTATLSGDAGAPAFMLNAASLSGPLAPGASALITVSFLSTGTGSSTALLEIAGSTSAPVATRLSLAGAAVAPVTHVRSAYLKSSSPGREDHFGTEVAVSGNTVVVGAPGEDRPITGGNNLTDSGAVYVFVKTGDGWRREAQLTVPDGASGDGFGSAVAVDGDTLVVGAPGVDGNSSGTSAQDAGAAYLFTRSGGVWTRRASIRASNLGAHDRFGSAVSISGDVIAVGAPDEDSASTGVNGDESNDYALHSGAVYLFTRKGGTWERTAYLKASNTRGWSYFGSAVSLSGDTVVVGAGGENSAGTGVNGDQTRGQLSGAGAAYVFTGTSGVWSQQAYLKASSPGSGERFGQSVGISGNTVIVGVPGDDSGAAEINGDQADSTASFTGAACVFVRTGSVWSQQAWLKTSSTLSFGTSVAISGDMAVVGTSQIQDTAYVFQRTGTVWARQTLLKAPPTGIPPSAPPPPYPGESSPSAPLLTPVPPPELTAARRTPIRSFQGRPFCSKPASV